MQYRKLEGIIINRRAVAEADRFYTIYTLQEGKLSVFAKSVRSIKSKRVSSLDLFSLINFEFLENGGRRTLTHVELVDSFRAGKKQLRDVSRLFQIGELIDVLVPEGDPQESVYRLLQTALTHLSRFETSEYLTRFKLRLLHELGYGDRNLTPDKLDSYIESLISKPLLKDL